MCSYLLVSRVTAESTVATAGDIMAITRDFAAVNAQCLQAGLQFVIWTVVLHTCAHCEDYYNLGFKQGE